MNGYTSTNSIQTVCPRCCNQLHSAHASPFLIRSLVSAGLVTSCPPCQWHRHQPCHHQCHCHRFATIIVFFITNALCCYPNINSAIRNLGLNTPTAPIFLQFNYFRENIWVIIWVQFHFLYIFVGRVDRIHKTSHITMLSFYFSLQTSKVLGTS